MSEELKEQEEEPKTIEKKHTFSFPASVTNFTERLEIELEPSDYTVNWIIHRVLRELLGTISDYDLVRLVCQSEEQGIYGLHRAIHTGMPQYYDYAHPEEYQAFLTRLEDLVKMEMVPTMNSASPSFIYPHYRDRRAHPHSLIIYALAVAALGKEVYPLAMNVMQALYLLRVDLPETPWARHYLNQLSFYRYRSGY